MTNCNILDALPWIATIAAVAAFLISWQEARRNNKVMLKLGRLRGGYTEEPRGSRHELEVWIVNRGIHLQNLSVALWFRGSKGSGTSRLPIPLSEHSKHVEGTFLRGMTASFLLTDAQKEDRLFLGLLNSFEEQEPAICVYSGSFLVRSFDMVSRLDWLKRYWNRLSVRLHFKRRVAEGYDGKGVYKYYQLPIFCIRSDQLDCFLQGVRKQAEDPH